MSDSVFLNSTHTRATRYSNVMLRPSTAPVLSNSGATFDTISLDANRINLLLPLRNNPVCAAHSVPGGGSAKSSSERSSNKSNAFKSVAAVGQGIDLCNEEDLACLTKRLRGSAKRALARESFETVPRSLHGISLVDDLENYPLDQSHSKRFHVQERICVEVYPDDLSPKSSVLASSQYVTHFFVHNTGFGADVSGSRFRAAVVQAGFVPKCDSQENVQRQAGTVEDGVRP
jgi:hypothetical protein